ncbi:MAG: hypothetical protein H6831_15375 [Planctomycetes bacterium]|nr:hypothetical protein [Planctomycetota bacterium]
MRRAPGRETRLLVSGEERLIEKLYVGGGGCEAWRERLRGTAARSPARREYDALVELHELGVPVPRALALAEDGRRSCVRMSYVPHAETLAERLAEAPTNERRQWGNALLDVVLRLHRAGWYHRDLYFVHFLVRSDGGLCLIDLGRARRDAAPRQRWFEKDLAALEHSAPGQVTRRERLRFLAAYLTGRGVGDRNARRRFAAAVGRRAERMARHRPKHGVSHPLPTEVRA